MGNKNIEQGIMNVEGKNLISRNSVFDIQNLQSKKNIIIYIGSDKIS